MAEVTPPVIQAPSTKERKYDRQLRLWAANGQAALEASHILLINSGPGVVGIETLKNLVLPGIGQFTILDPSLVTAPDLGAHFFLEDRDLGASRAERCSQWLQELNPDVKAHHIAEHLDVFFGKQDSLLPYTLIIVALPIASAKLIDISRRAEELSIPVFFLHCVGFYSHFTIQLPDAFPIVDTHPDPSTVVDLRLLEPWPELLDHLRNETSDMDQMDDERHGHIPYVLLLLRSLEEWKNTHEGRPPQTYREKSDFRALVKRGARTDNAEGGEENFDEAAAAVLKSLNPAVPSSAVKEVFAADECRNLSKDSANFWIIAHAIRTFFNDHGVLPVSGGLPDMKAKSADYIQLQNIYRSKSQQDVAEIMGHVRTLATSLGKNTQIAQSEVEAFCKCAGYIKLVRGRFPHLAQAPFPMQWRDRAKFAANALDNPDSLILIYIAFLANDTFASNHGLNYPGDKAGELQPFKAESIEDVAKKVTDIARMIIDGLIKESDASAEEFDYSHIESKVSDIVTELVRARGGELHCVSALTGGMVAQEVIKVITKQYIPVDNTCIFDGVLSKTSVIRL